MPAPPFPRADLPTPALVIDRAAMARNIAAMAGFAAAHGVALRPHAKTHKSAELARLQLAAGAVGLCCAKLGEAEALAAEGVDDILITSPLVTRQAIRRAVTLNAKIRLALVVDHPDNARAVDAALGEGQLRVLIDVDPGQCRTGVTSIEAAVTLARTIAALPRLELAGVQFYCGSLQHVVGIAARRAAIAARTSYLRAVLAALHADGHAVPIVTGGGTGSFAFDAEFGVLTELQVGSYLFLDRDYRDAVLAGPAFESALFVDATVVSANLPGQVTIDAGLKALAADSGPAVPIGLDATYRFMGDEHGALASDGGLPGLGERVVLMPGHCDPTVNLYDCYHVVEGDEVVAIWPVTARGKGS